MMPTQAQPPPPIARRKSNNGGGSCSFESSFVYPSGVILNVAVLQTERRALVLMVPETGFEEISGDVPKGDFETTHVSLAENHRCDPVVRLRITSVLSVNQQEAVLD
jgi:hypothetical protein